jgi:hypothetical protein
MWDIGSRNGLNYQFIWGQPINDVAVSLDGELLAMLGPQGQVYVIDPVRKRHHRTQLPGEVKAITFAADSRHLLTGNANGTVGVLRLRERLP